MAARNPFTHASSSANLRSLDHISPPKGYPPLPTSPTDLPSISAVNGIHAVTTPHHRHAQSRPMVKKDSGDLSNPYFLNAPNPFYRSNAPTPTRTPSPNPFAVPRFTMPTVATIRFVALCLLWYMCSALSSNTGKVILNNFRFPVTLTIVQFFFVAGLCFLFSRPELGWTTRLRSPTQAIVRGTLPMAAFQVGGHIFSSLAISRVPVSTVHTIKVSAAILVLTNYTR
jgi:solute carrier family 35 protein E1